MFEGMAWHGMAWRLWDVQAQLVTVGVMAVVLLKTEAPIIFKATCSGGWGPWCLQRAGDRIGDYQVLLDGSSSLSEDT